MTRFFLILLIFSVFACHPDPAHVRQVEPALEATTGPARASMSVNQLAFDLEPRFEADKNAIISPLSISSAMALAHLGSKGQTRAQMDDVLRYGVDIHPSLSTVQASIRDLDRPDNELGPEVLMANDLWLAQRFANDFKAEYLRESLQYYNAEPTFLDFADPEPSRQTINQHVSDLTREHIPELLPVGVIDATVAAVITNALYLHASWQLPFPKDRTTEKAFHRLDGTTTQVAMMHQTEDHLYYRGSDFQAVSIPVAGSSLRAMILLPNQSKFVDLGRRMNAGYFALILDEMEERLIELGLPRFTLRMELELSRTLADMGMPDSFDPEKANFSAMSDLPLFITDVIHQAYLDVHEDGTTAAAATAVVMRPTSARIDQPLTVLVDRPFYFNIYDDQSRTILFYARVADPGLQN